MTNIAGLAGVLLVIAIGESIPALHQLDEVLAPHRESLRTICIAAIALGFAIFMGGILHSLLRQTRPRERVIAGGVFLASLAGAALLIVTATAGLKFLVILVCLYVVFRIFVVVRWD